MADFNRNKFSRGREGGGFRSRPSFGDRAGGGRPSFGDRGDRGPVEMHDAVCDNCGKNCQVPFRPTSGKPVYCSNCFEQKNGDSGSSRFESRVPGRSNFEEREMSDVVCDECGKNCQVPFRPTEGKPIYCSDCFGDKKNNGSKGGGGSAPSREEFDRLNAKLDKILGILESAVVEEEEDGEEVVEIVEPVPAEAVESVVEEIAPKVVKKKRASKQSLPTGKKAKEEAVTV